MANFCGEWAAIAFFAACDTSKVIHLFNYSEHSDTQISYTAKKRFLTTQHWVQMGQQKIF